MLEPRITPTAAEVPSIYWLDQIDVAVELPMGEQGEPGENGDKWQAGALYPPNHEAEDGTMYLGGDGKVYQYTNGVWVYTDVDLTPTGGVAPHPHPEYLMLDGSRAMTGPLTGVDSTFTGAVSVPTPTGPAGPPPALSAVNVEYLTKFFGTGITNLNLNRFLGDTSGNAIPTNGNWNTAESQAIYYQSENIGVNPIPGVTGPTVGLVIKQDNLNIIQLVCEIDKNLWFTRGKVAGTWGAWSTVGHIVQPVTRGPTGVVPPGATGVAPNGTIWIQVIS